MKPPQEGESVDSATEPGGIHCPALGLMSAGLTSWWILMGGGNRGFANELSPFFKINIPRKMLDTQQIFIESYVFFVQVKVSA